MNKYFPGQGRVEYRPDAGPEDTLVFRHYNASETVHGKPMEEWLRFSPCYFNAFRYLGDEGAFGGATHQRPYEEGPAHSLDKYKRRLVAAFEFFHKLGVKYYSVSDRDLAPEGDSFEETAGHLDEAVALAVDLQKQSGVRPLYFGCDLFSHPRYMHGAAASPDAHVFAYASAQVKRGLEAAKRLGADNFVFFHPRDGFQSLVQRQPLRDASHLAQLYRMAVQYREKLGYKGQLLVQPRHYQYEADAAAAMHLLRHFGLDKQYKLNLRPAPMHARGTPADHDVQLAAAFNMLGSIDAAPARYADAADDNDRTYDVRDATLVMKCVLEMGGLGVGGVTLGARLRRQSVEPKDLFEGHVLAMDTYARALRNAARLISDGVFSRSLQQRYASYKSGLGERVEKGAATLEDCEEYVRKCGEPQPLSGRHEHFNAVLNHYVHPATQRQ